jgi:DEAD/DEAH box helicase domain-containing protein
MNWIYFDVETERAAHEVGGWSQIESLGLAVAVTLSSQAPEDAWRAFESPQARELGEALKEADVLVGFNSQRFDVRVLQPYLDFDLSALPHLDLMLDLRARLGFHPSLQACVGPTLGESKSASGLESIEWWRAGRRDEVIAYCARDVLLTRRLHEWGARHGHVLFRDRHDKVRQVEVDWSLDARRKEAQPSLFDF